MPASYVFERFGVAVKSGGVEEVLGYAQTQEVAEHYREENKDEQV